MKFFKDPSGMKFWIEKVGEKIWVHFKGRTFTLSQHKKKMIRRKGSNISKESYLRSPIPGRVLSLKVKEGDLVKKGDVLVVVESMKIEHSLTASQAGAVKSLLVKEGWFVKSNEKLLLFS